MIQARTVVAHITVALTMALAISACGKDESGGQGITITKMKPPVKAAAGSALTASSRIMKLTSIDPNNIKDRFFDAGPSSIMDILGSLDNRLGEIETRSAESSRDCLNAEPSDVTLSIYGESVTAKIQCLDDMGASGFLAFGKDGSDWWVIDAVGAAHTVAKASALENGKNEVEIWGGVGFTNASSFGSWDNGSYGFYHVKANNSTNEFEMTAGGIGMGFCGVNLRSDGINLYVEGSPDGAAGACSTTSSSCVLSSDLSGTGSCASINTFGLSRLGRASVAASSTVQGNTGVTNWDVSDWLTSSGVVINGNSTDGIHFVGLSDIPSSVGAF